MTIRLYSSRRSALLAAGLLLCLLAMPNEGKPLRSRTELGAITLKAIKLVAGEGIFTRLVSVRTIQRPNGSVFVEFTHVSSNNPPVEAVAEVRVTRAEKQTIWQVDISEEPTKRTPAEQEKAVLLDRIAERFCSDMAQRQPLPGGFQIKVTQEPAGKQPKAKPAFTVMFMPFTAHFDSQVFYRVAENGSISKR